MEAFISQMEQALAAAPKLKSRSGDWCSIDRVEMAESLISLKSVIPADIRAASAVLATKDTILSDAKAEASELTEHAQSKADSLVRNAQEEAERILDAADREAVDIHNQAVDYANAMVEETAVMQQARYRANDLLQEAEAHANRILTEAQTLAFESVDSANLYADEILQDLQRYTQGYLEQVNLARHALSEKIDMQNAQAQGATRERPQQTAPAPKAAMRIEYLDEEQASTHTSATKTAARPSNLERSDGADDYAAAAHRNPTTPARTQGTMPRRATPPYGDDFDGTDAYRAPSTPHRQSVAEPIDDNAKKKSWFQRMWNGDDVEDIDDDGWDDSEPAAQSKKRGGFKLFEVVEEDEE